MDEKKKLKGDRFVKYVLSRLERKPNGKLKDTAFRAALTRADNPATESQAWQYLANFCNMMDDNERQSYGLIAACMARKMVEKNGSQTLGQAMYLSKEKIDENDESMNRKFRRILACDNTQELIPVLRPILRYVTGKENVSLDYAQLLRDILYFNEKTKILWATHYYRNWKEAEECSSPE